MQSERNLKFDENDLNFEPLEKLLFIGSLSIFLGFFVCRLSYGFILQLVEEVQHLHRQCKY